MVGEGGDLRPRRQRIIADRDRCFLMSVMGAAGGVPLRRMGGIEGSTCLPTIVKLSEIL
jgi:hypothetical protein